MYVENVTELVDDNRQKKIPHVLADYNKPDLKE